MPPLAEIVATLVQRTRFYVGRRRFEREMAEEMRFHLELEARDNERDGMSPSEARDAARRRFGNVTRHQEAAMGMLSAEWLDTITQDLRYAARSLRKTPAFTMVAVLSLALGIGATTAVFTLVDAVLLRPLPYPDADRLVVVYQTTTPGMTASVDTMPWSLEKFRRLQQLVPAFSDAGFAAQDQMNLRGNEDREARGAERARVEVVTASLITTLGVKPAFGRVFAPDEDVPGVAHAAVLVSYRLWQRGIASVNSTIHLDGAPVTVVGVMPPDFTGFTRGADLWVPLYVMPRIRGGVRWIDRLDNQMGTMIARVRPGVAMSVVDGQVDAAAVALRALFPEPGGRGNVQRGAGVMRLDEARRHPLLRPLLRLLSVAVGAVLLIVCANVAGLLLARGRARQSEMGVRIALGAGRGRIARQVMTESLVLAALGAPPGLGVGIWGAAAVAHLRPRLPQVWVLLRGTDPLEGISLAPDWRVLAFATSLTLFVGLVFGAGPAIVASRTRVGELLNTGRSWFERGRVGGRRSLVVTQVALATMLLVGAGLMLRSLRLMLRSDLGFDPNGVIVIRLAPGDTSSTGRTRRAELVPHLAAIPGVDGVATHNCVPFDQECMFMMPLFGDDAQRVDPSRAPLVAFNMVSADYVRVMRIPIVAGRGFDPREVSGNERRSALINETAARRLWTDGRSPIGRRLAVQPVEVGANAREPADPFVEVIGVVGDAKFDAIDRPPTPAIYLRDDAILRGELNGTLVVRARGDVASTMAALRHEVVAIDPTVAIFGIAAATDLVSGAASGTRFITALLVGFAAAAAFLAALGVYGVLAYVVVQRTREFGVRMAIGASSGSVLALVVRQGATLTLVGLALGIAGALAATGLLTRFLYGVPRADVPTYAAIITIVGIAGLIAAYVPARRATRVDPVLALRA